MKKYLLILFLSANLFSQDLFLIDIKNPILNGAEEHSLSGLEQTSSTIPGGFYLGQNFPNPFNPVTNIYFSLPYQQHVRLVVMNMLGQEVDELINYEMTAGTYKFSYDASKLASGVYVYRFQSEDYSDSKKMLLIK